MFDHLSLGVEILDRAGAFYDAALAPLGYVRLWRSARGVGYGPPGFQGEAPFAIVEFGSEAKPPGRGSHIAFVAPSREAVDRFHAAALSAGGADEGRPGVRESYDPGYYAAFVRDLDGHRLEAVLHERPTADRLDERELARHLSCGKEDDGEAAAGVAVRAAAALIR